jgi:tRNA (cmo5U34)-methyltransferase
MGTTHATDFDTNPPVPVMAYEQVVTGVNMGYEFIFELTHAFLRSLEKLDLDLLVVGAGGGAEIAAFLPDNPGWRITGVDPSRQMLDLARAKAARLGVADRVTLVEGSVDALPADRRFDAATCLYVLHFLADDAKRALLRGMRQHLVADAPAMSVSGCRVDTVTAGPLRDDLLGAWRQYGEQRGVPAAQMQGIITELIARQAEATPEEGYRALMHEAGFTHVVTVLSVMQDAMCAWIAR